MQYRWETPRLFIRPYRLEDGDAVWRVVRRPEIYATTYAIPRNYPRARVDWWISFVKNSRVNGTGYEFGFFEKESGRYFGNCGIINVRKDLFSGSITYFADPDAWGLGLTTEAGEAMLRFAFDELELARVGGTCMSANPASRRVMEKLGFSYEGTGRCELYKDGIFYDVDHLSILRPEWKRRCAEGNGFSTAGDRTVESSAGRK